MVHNTAPAIPINVKSLIQAGLEEDGWPWDWSTLGAVKDPLGKVNAQLIAKAPGIWAGTALIHSLNSVAKELAEISSGHFLAKAEVKDGAAVKPGQRVASFSGSAGLVLALERPFLNLAQYSSGIATATHELVSLVKKSCPKNPPRVTSTRKTLPGYRDLAVYALQMGGGFAHRVSLSGGVLIKENHIAASGGIAKAIEGARAIAPHGLKIEVEVKNLQELELALAGNADVVMLDNFSVEDVRRAIKVVDAVFAPGSRARPILEVSGGLSPTNIGKYAQRGVDILSVGYLTHSIKALDLSLLIDM
jgi:nicotinate-nucleotide pyrophosphorylase (carboxylating)